MQTRTYTLLVTVTDDSIAAVFDPDCLAAALQGALETGINSFPVNSDAAARLGVPSGEHFMNPVASVTVDAFVGDCFTHPSNMYAADRIKLARVRELHRELRAGA